MRMTLAALGLVGVAAALCSAYATGCTIPCELNGTCAPSAAGTSGSGGAGGATVNLQCVPSVNTAPVDKSCGVFVSSSVGDDAAAGTPGAPVKTLAQAVALAKDSDMRVYACAETFAESVSVPAGLTIYGGLACMKAWQYVGDTMKTSVAPMANAAALTQIAIVMAGGAGTSRVEDVAITAPDATLPGGSSIAVLVDGADAELTRCELIAGNGMTGAKGATPSAPVGPADANDSAIKGDNGAAACLGDPAVSNPGGMGRVNALCSNAAGGNGGAGLVANGADGLDGTPVGAAGKHGVGQPAAGGWSCGATGNAQGGDNGSDGPSGAGASSASPGSLAATGFINTAGASGNDGTPGQGGGGGGGAKGKLNCNGASGGGGGAGGCGGKGGLGGQGGGASIALARIGGTVVLKNISLSTGNGGDGGDGGDGQAGAVGGVGGLGGLGDPNAPATSKACSGGEGGQGGFGGKGGGGLGGPSIGIAYLGVAPATDGVTFALGEAGKGGLGADAAGNGADGVKINLQEFK